MAFASLPDNVYFATLAELGQRLKQKEFSSHALTQGFLDRLETLGPRYNALSLALTKPALRAAKDADDDMKRERFRGPLQGIPFGAKDLLSYAGHPTTWGARPYSDQVFDYTATALQKLAKTGAILIGKLAMVELAGGPSYRYAAASVTGPCLNPWDTTRWSGGSSSGPAAAVAAGLVPFALGSETSGSIVTPSAFCGITGLRPTYGLVSRHGAMPLSWTMDKIGPMCRTADDCGMVLHAIAGADSEDPGSAGKSFYYTPEFVQKMPELRVGLATIDFDEWAEPSARAALAKALDTIRGLGVQVTAAKLPDFPYGPMAGTIIAAEGASVFESLIASGKVNQLSDAKQIAGLKAGLEIPAKDYLKAMRIRELMKLEFRDLLADVDVLLTPARLGPAPKISQPLDQPLSDRPRPADRGLTQLIPAGNLAGLPALSLPCGFADGVPVGISLVGRPFSENVLLAIGRAFQNVTDWHKQHPPAIA